MDPNTTKVRVRVGDLPASVITRLDPRLALAPPETAISVSFPIFAQIQRAKALQIARVPVPSLALASFKSKPIVRGTPNVRLILDDMLDQVVHNQLREKHKIVELTLHDLLKTVTFN